MAPTSPRSDPESGFTLLELLVAITLLGFLMMALMGGLRLGARAWETSEDRVDDTARLIAVQDFVRDRLREIFPLSREVGDSFVEYFEGSPEVVRFVTRLPLHLGGGFYLATLGLIVDDDAERRHFGIVFEPLRVSGEEAFDPGGRRSRILMPDVEAVEFGFFGPDERSPGSLWTDIWRLDGELPHLIRVRLRFAEDDNRSWPELVARPVIDQSFEYFF